MEEWLSKLLKYPLNITIDTYIERENHRDILEILVFYKNYTDNKKYLLFSYKYSASNLEYYFPKFMESFKRSLENMLENAEYKGKKLSEALSLNEFTGWDTPPVLYI